MFSLFFPPSPTRLLPDLTKGNTTAVLLETGTAYHSKPPWFIPFYFSVLWYMLLIILVFCVMFIVLLVFTLLVYLNCPLFIAPLVFSNISLTMSCII